MNFSNKEKYEFTSTKIFANIYIYLYWKLTKNLMEETVTGVREHAQAPTCRHIHICMVYGEDGKLTSNCLI